MTRKISAGALLALASFLIAGVALAMPAAQGPAAAPACPAALSAPLASAYGAAQPVAPVWLAEGKCASCSELLKACKAFCGANNVNFNCQNSSPCAGTCTCIVPPS